MLKLMFINYALLMKDKIVNISKKLSKYNGMSQGENLTINKSKTSKKIALKAIARPRPFFWSKL